MAFQLKRDTTPLGVTILRLVSSGRITGAEAADIMKEIAPGGAHHRLPMLVISKDDVEVTAEARRVFTRRVEDGDPPTAIVSTSTVLRVTVNFIGRVNGNNNMRLFAGEPEALRWLDTQCARANDGAA